MNSRVEKGNSLLKKNLSTIILNELNDPRLKSEIITITKVSLSCDLKYARVFTSVLNQDSAKEVVALLNKASGHIRKLLTGKLEFRVVPELYFVVDDSEEYSDRINSLLKNIKYSDDNEI